MKRGWNDFADELIHGLAWQLAEYIVHYAPHPEDACALMNKARRILSERVKHELYALEARMDERQLELAYADE